MDISPSARCQITPAETPRPLCGGDAALYFPSLPLPSITLTPPASSHLANDSHGLPPRLRLSARSDRQCREPISGVSDSGITSPFEGAGALDQCTAKDSWCNSSSQVKFP